MLLVLKHALWQDLKRCGGEKKHTQILGFTCKNNDGKENCVIHATNSGTPNFLPVTGNCFSGTVSSLNFYLH